MDSGIIGSIVRLGDVTAVDAAHCRARVIFRDAGITSGWLYVLQHSGAGVIVAADGAHTHAISDTYSGGGRAETVNAHTHDGTALGIWVPSVNDAVVCLYLPTFNGDGFILGKVVV